MTRTPTACDLFELMERIEEFQNEHTEELDFETYEMLSETATVLRTLANVASSPGHRYMIHRFVEAKSDFKKICEQLKQKTK